MYAGDIVESRPHYDRAIALYDPAQHRPLAARFGADVAVTVLTHRPLALWVLGYPEAALADVEHALDDAREIPHAATLMHALFFTAWTHTHCGNHLIAKAQLDELVALAEEKSSLFWKTLGMLTQRCALALTGETTDSAHTIASGIKAFRSTGGTLWAPSWVSYLARAYADIGQFDDAWRCIAEATKTVQTTKEKWCEAEVHRTAGEIALKSPHPDLAKAEAYFERALAVAREQGAKS
jgi:predicted ATPase